MDAKYHYYIDEACNEIILKIEELRKFLKEGARATTQINYRELLHTSKEGQRKEMLEETIRDAIAKLEETKKSFKSKKVKEARENLVKAIGQ